MSKKRKSIKERLIEIINRDLKATLRERDVYQNKGCLVKEDVCNWETRGRADIQIYSYDTMTAIVKAGGIEFVNDRDKISPKEVCKKQMNP